MTTLRPALAASLLLALAATAVASHGVPIANHGFELGLAGWTTFGGSGCSHGTEGPSTDKAYRGVDASASGACGIHQTVAIVPGTYSVYADVQVSSGTAELRVTWLDASGNEVGSHAGTSTFTGIAFQASTPAGATHARFTLQSASASADFVADDAHLVPI